MNFSIFTVNITFPINLGNKPILAFLTILAVTMALLATTFWVIATNITPIISKVTSQSSIEINGQAELSINATAQLHVGDSAPQKTLDIAHDKHHPNSQKAD